MELKTTSTIHPSILGTQFNYWMAINNLTLFPIQQSTRQTWRRLHGRKWCLICGQVHDCKWYMSYRYLLNLAILLRSTWTVCMRIKLLRRASSVRQVTYALFCVSVGFPWVQSFISLSLTVLYDNCPLSFIGTCIVILRKKRNWVFSPQPAQMMNTHTQQFLKLR